VGPRRGGEAPGHRRRALDQGREVRASAAAPYLHPRVPINGKEYVDGHLSDPFPVEKALADGYDEIVVVCNKSRESVPNLSKSKENRVRTIFPSSKSPVRWNFDSSKDRINQLVDLGIRDALAFIG
jgi:predicted acylesterase/phospholipase RssA